MRRTTYEKKKRKKIKGTENRNNRKIKITEINVIGKKIGKWHTNLKEKRIRTR